MNEPEQVQMKVFGTSLYRVYLDGAEIAEGPSRFAPDHPEYDVHDATLQEGSYVLSVIVHDYGVHTRILMGGIHPFMQCEVIGTNGVLQLEWKCKELSAFQPIDRRINGQLGWMECCDTRLVPDLQVPFEGGEWVDAREIANPLGNVTYRPKSIRDCLRLPVEAIEMARGTYADRFGYENDDPPMRFIFRDLKPQLPADGMWVRFDLGKIGLYRPHIVIDAPKGTVIEAGYSESLNEGRVFPVIPLSYSTSCHVDRWITKGGLQELQTFVPRGFRFIEIHIYAPPSVIPALQVSGVQRTSYDGSVGAFQCSDPLLNAIWSMGVETLRSCCEDAVIDTPTRERGQWIGDAAAIGMEILGVSFGELDLIRRSLQQASYRRRDDGLAAGLCPGQEAYLTTYALYWIDGCVRYFRLTGDRSLLEECYETADITIDFFLKHMHPRGTVPPDTWDFIDWGHAVDAGEVNVSLNLTLLHTLGEMAAWEQILGFYDKGGKRNSQIAALRQIVNEHYFTQDGLLAKSVPLEGPSSLSERKAGYHATALGLLYGLFDSSTKPRQVEFMKNHIMNCFPNNRDAPRLAHPSANQDRLITPSFAHFALQALWEAGEADFVLEQYRTCWGWMLEQGATTLLEVFDTRWSHCHAWSGSPTWQLSRYSLGLIPQPDKGINHYRLRFQPGALTFASGNVPMMHDKGLIHIEWKRTSSREWEYVLETDHPIFVSIEGNPKVAHVILDNTEIAVGTKLEVQRRLVLKYAN